MLAGAHGRNPTAVDRLRGAAPARALVSEGASTTLGGVSELAYTPLERLPPLKTVDRVSYLVDQVRGKTIYDLGAYDETAVFKRGTGLWLHESLGKAAARVIGIDNSPKLPAEGLVTGPSSAILHGDIFRLGERDDAAAVQAIVAGELIEHLPNTLAFFRSLASAPALKGKAFMATTPNATAVYNSMLGITRRESMHHDHLQVYSYKTLNTLCMRAGFSSWKILAYHASFPEMRLNEKGLLKVATGLFENAVHLVESAFPLLSGGYIVHATL